MSDLDKLNLSTEISMKSIASDASEKSPKITACRFAARTDLRKIGNLVKCRTLNLFPEAENPIALYEKSCLPLVQENQLDQIVSAIFLSNYPNVPAVSPSAWPSWIDKLYDVKDASAANTLFVDLVLCDGRRYNERDLLVDLLTTAFYVVSRCDYIVLVMPPTIQPAYAIGEVMRRVAPKTESVEVVAQVLYVADRRQFVPQLKFRMAVEEDNDDIIQMLDSDTTLLREFYGDFYASELSRHPDPWRRIVIGDTDNHAATVACLNERIDLELLNDRFELTAFDELRRQTVKFAPSLDDSVEEYEEDYQFRVHKRSSTDSETSRVINTTEPGIEFSDVYSDDESEVQDERLSISSARGDAFALELLGFRWDEALLLASSRDLLVAAFECFPRLRYCLALMPTDRQHFPFLDHFTRVPLKPDKDFPMALYVVHRASILHKSFRVREARKEDREAVYRLLGHTDNIFDDLNEALKHSEDHSRRCYVFTCDNVIAGMAIVRREEAKEVDRLNDYYRVEDLLGKQQQRQQADALRLLGFALAPIFQASTGFFLGEIMRLEANDAAATPAMFYRSIGTKDAPPSCLWTMQAVEPRMRNWPQFQRYFEREQDEDSPFDELFSLHVTSTRLATMIKQIVNVKIVVVGASNCGLAFIESLTSGYKYRDLQFADITLISTNGLPYEHSSDYSIRTMIPFRGRYCHAYRNLTSGSMNYNVVKGTVIEIDRKKRQVYIEDSGTLSYDYLVLTCGVLFQKPEFSNESHRDSDGEEVPSNYFCINDDVDAVNCLKAIKKLTKNFKVKKSIVFHGSNVECYCALAAFLELGLEGSWIALIEPKPLARDDIFIGDCEIRDQLREIISALGVKLFSSYDLADWKLSSSSSSSSSWIESIVLLRQENNDDDDAVGRTAVVTCDALLGFHVKSPCLKTFLAISHAGLVFDGRLVIDAEFRTNDRRVFAAGTMTKYSRRLRADDREHKYFNSLQVGEKLAERFVSIIMADIDETVSSEKFNALRLPEFSAPIIVSCLLPGGYRYLHVRKPGARLEHQEQWRDDVFTTGSCTADTGYFRLRLNQFRALECVTCFSKTDFNIQNVIALYGKHEALFNDLKTRFLNAEIPDFYAYFREPWATALFADDFDDRCLRGKRSDYDAISNEAELRENLFHEVMNVLKNLDDEKMMAKDREEILSNQLERGDDDKEGRSVYVKEMRERLIEYLERHEYELPMYSMPEKRRQILREIAEKPLLSDCKDDDYDNSRQSSPSCSCSCSSSSNEDATHVLESSSECHCSSSSDGDRANLMPCHLSCSSVFEG